MVKSKADMFDHARNPLLLQTKFEDIQRYTHAALFQFPKKERFLLCAQIQTAVDDTMHDIFAVTVPGRRISCRASVTLKPRKSASSSSRMTTSAASST